MEITGKNSQKFNWSNFTVPTPYMQIYILQPPIERWLRVNGFSRFSESILWECGPRPKMFFIFPNNKRLTTRARAHWPKYTCAGFLRGFIYNSIFKSAKLKLANKKCKIIYDTYRNYMIYLNHLKGRETIMYIFYDLIGFEKKIFVWKIEIIGLAVAWATFSNENHSWF